jgi:hypothetical protein
MANVQCFFVAILGGMAEGSEQQQKAGETRRSGQAAGATKPS